MDRDNTIARLENIAKHAVHTAGEDTFILSLDDGLAIHEAIEALKAQLSKEGATSDLISRQAALDTVGKYASVWMEYTDAMSKDEIAQIALNNAKSTMIRILKELPTVQHERKKGEWLPDNNNAYEMRFVCSCCKESEVVPTIGFTKYKPLWDYCPNCGADMRGEKDG